MSKVMDELLEKVKHERNIEFAQKLLANNMSIEFTANCSDLPLEEVRKLAAKQSA